MIKSHEEKTEQIFVLPSKYDKKPEEKPGRNNDKQKDIDKKMEALRTCELCKKNDDICECTQEVKDNFYVEQIVQHEIQQIQTQNRYQLLEQGDPERPKSVQTKLKNLFSSNKSTSSRNDKTKNVTTKKIRRSSFE